MFRKHFQYITPRKKLNKAISKSIIISIIILFLCETQFLIKSLYFLLLKEYPIKRFNRQDGKNFTLKF